MDLERQITVELDYEQLPAAPDALEPAPLERGERRVERLQRVDARRQRRLDLGAGDGGTDQAGGDLDLG